MRATDRSVHLVGTVPASDAAEVFELVGEILDGRVGVCVPDGETGDRLDWVNRIVESLRAHPDLELAREGAWTSYEDTPAFQVRKGHRFDHVDLDYVDAFRQSWPIYLDKREQLGDGAALQVGIPGHLDLALIAFGFKLVPGLRNVGPFRDATLREMALIHDAGGDDVVFQLEVPIELIMLTKLPAVARRAAAGRFAAEILKVVRRSAPGTRFGIHLCYGDLNHESMGTPEDAGALVALANALVDRWPEGRRLEFLHAPFARGAEPPPLHPDFYTPLADLRLPASTRFAAGFIHEGRTADELGELLSRIEGLLGREVDVAASCGLGRRDQEQARRNLELSRQVVEAASASGSP